MFSAITSWLPSFAIFSTALGGVGNAVASPQLNDSNSSPVTAIQGPPRGPSADRSALLMIEFVNEWLAPEGKLRHLLRDKEQFEGSQPAAQQALAAARKSGMQVVHVTLQLSSDYRELGRARFGLRGAIPMAQTWRKEDSGGQFHPSFSPRPQEFVVSGRAGASAFAASDLDNYLRGQGITRLYLAGYATHVCIESTLRAAHDLGYEPVVLTDATAAFTAHQKQYFLNDVVPHFGWAMPTQAFVDMVTSESPADPKAPDTPGMQRDSPALMRHLTARGQEIPGVSGAVRVDGGRLMLLSGHVPVGGDGSIATTLEAQLKQVFQNLDATLQAAGGNTGSIARLTFYVRGYRAEHLSVIRRVRDRWLGTHSPASTLIGVEALFHPDVLVEVDGMAVLVN